MMPLIFFGAISCLSESSFAQETAPPTLETHESFWPEHFLEAANHTLYDIKSRFVTAVFEDPTAIDLGGFGVGALNISGNIRREIFNNFDTINSWTIVDQTRLNLDLGGLIALGSNTPSTLPNFNPSWISFSAGPKAYVDWWDIRQLLPEDFERAKKNTAPAFAPLYTQFRESDVAETDIQNLNPYLHGDIADFPGQVKLHKILNLIKQPFKMPLHAAIIKKYMVDGEILRYNVTGDISTGVALGPNLSLPNNNSISAGVSASLDFRGEFQFSVQRENARYAKLRISMLQSRTDTFAAGTKISIGTLFKGFIVFKIQPTQTTVGAFGTTLIPFQISTSQARTGEEDWGFKYDLDSLKGRDAFHHAVLGNLKPSEDLAKAESLLQNKSVEFLFKDHNTRISSARSKLTDLILFYKKQKKFQKETLETEVNRPSGEDHLYRQVSELTKEKRDPTGHVNQSDGKISFYLDKDAFLQKEPHALSLLIEESIDDSETDGNTLRTYCKNIETFFDEKNIFPELPLRIPRISNPKKTKIANYGRSAFYYGYSLSQEQVYSLLSMDLDALEQKIDEESLAVPLSHFKKARAAYETQNVDQLEHELKKLLSTRNRELDFIQLVIETIDKKNTEKFLVAQNNSFGSIQDHGHKLTRLERFYREMDTEMSATEKFSRTTEDPDSILSNLTATTLADGRIKINFEVTTKPEYLYFRIHPDRRKRDEKNVSEFIFWNRSETFKEGKNSLIIDPTATDPLVKTLAQWMLPNKNYILTMGYSNHDKRWGYGNSLNFKTGQNFLTLPKEQHE